jgi:hypothetical protein
MLSTKILLFLAVLILPIGLNCCNSAYKTASATVPTKAAKKKEAADKKALKKHLKKQEAKKRHVEELEHLDRTPVPVDKYKKGTPKSPETYY